jgi:hypothetical protein
LVNWGISDNITQGAIAMRKLLALIPIIILVGACSSDATSTNFSFSLQVVNNTAFTFDQVIVNEGGSNVAIIASNLASGSSTQTYSKSMTVTITSNYSSQLSIPLTITASSTGNASLNTGLLLTNGGSYQAIVSYSSSDGYSILLDS